MRARIILITAFLCAFAGTARAQGEATWASLQTALDNASTDANIPTVLTLAADIIADASDTYLSITGGRHVILDLNGHTIDRHLDAAKTGGHVIGVNSGTSLTIRDSQGGGQITGGYTAASAGGISVAGTLTLESGSICGNRSNNYGGGLGVSGTFNMTGGSITGNYCGNSGEGSAIYINGGYVNISGGTITANYGNSAIYHYGHVTLSGSYDIGGNTLANGTTPAPDIKSFGKVINMGGVVSPTHPATIAFDGGTVSPFTSGWATYMSGADPELAFTLANPNGQGIGLNASGEATIGALHTITLGDGITASATQAAPGRPITLSGASALTTSGGITYATDYIISYNDGEAHADRYAADALGNATFTMPAADASVSTETVASGVAYIDADGNEQLCTNFTVVQSSNTDQTLGSSSSNQPAWYVVLPGTVTVSGKLWFNDPDVRLILCDGANFTLTYDDTSADDALSSPNGALSIYGQSQQSGALNVTCPKGYAISSINGSTVTINGGTVSATGIEGFHVMGGNIIINGGTVSATGTAYGIFGSTVTINGGSVNATGNYGILGSNVTINGGTVTATSPDNRSCSGIYGNTITLGWTNAADRITSSSYKLNIVIKTGQTLYDGDIPYSGTIDGTAIAGKTLAPYPGAGSGASAVTARKAAFAGVERYWATFYDPSIRYALPAGTQAFYMKNDHALYRIGDGSVIPANCAVVIMAEASALTNSTATSGLILLTTTEAAAPAVTGNILQGNGAATPVSSLGLQTGQKVYVLGASGGTVGFFEFSGTDVPGGKAYYVE